MNKQNLSNIIVLKTLSRKIITLIKLICKILEHLKRIFILILYDC